MSIIDITSVQDASVQQLVWNDDGGVVVVTPRDRNRYELKLHNMMDLLKIGSEEKRFEHQFRILQNIIATWIRNTPGVKRAFITVRDGALYFVTIRQEIRYQADFEDALSALDLEIASDHDLSLIKLSSIALPNCSDEAIASFLNPDFVLEYVHGETNRSSDVLFLN